MILLSDDLIPLTGLQIWLKAHDIVATDGATISSWPDSSINGVNATQTTSSYRPYYRASVAEIYGRPAVEFVSDCMTFGVQTVGNTDLFADEDGRFSVFVVAKATATGTILSRGSGSGRSYFLGYHNTNGLQHIIRGTTTNIACDTNFHIHSDIWDGTSFKYYIDGGSAIDVSVGTSTIQSYNIVLGAMQSTTTRLTGYIAEVIIYDRAVSDTERLQIEAYLRAKYFEADTTPPGPVTNVKEAHTYNSITLTWTNPTDRDFGSVTVQEINTSTTIQNITNGRCVFENLTSETEYEFHVFTKDTSGKVCDPTDIVVIKASTNSISDHITGNGTQQDPYVVWTLAGLDLVRENLDAYYELGCDIDASDTINWNDGAGWIPIGNNIARFNGKFDGKGHRINDLYINRPSEDYIGLFGTSNYADGSYIRNLGLENVNIRGYNYCGALIGSSNSDLINCYSTGSVRARGYIGGLAGISPRTYRASICTNCYSRCSVIAETSWVGGVVGSGDLITYCYATGLITALLSYIGGVLGGTEGDLSNHLHWDIETTGRTTTVGSGTGLTTAQMKNSANFIDWDFENVWSIDPNINDGYPYLRVFETEVVDTTPPEDILDFYLNITSGFSSKLYVTDLLDWAMDITCGVTSKLSTTTGLEFYHKINQSRTNKVKL